MPISTIPNTPSRHSVGMEHILKSPQARARNRWVDQQGKPSSSQQQQQQQGSVQMKLQFDQHDDDEARLITPSSPSDAPPPSTGSDPSPTSNGRTTAATKRSWYFLLLTVLVCIGIITMFRDETVTASQWIFDEVSSTLRNSETEKPEVRAKWTFVTGTSPFAVTQACKANSAHRMHDERIVGVETVESIVESLTHRYQRGESLMVCGPPPQDGFSRLLRENIRVMVYVENGLMASFDKGFAIWAKARGVEQDIEDSIDESCLARRIETRRKYSCTITEIGVLRAAEIWYKLTNQALRFSSIKTVDLPTSTTNNEAMKRLEEMSHQSLVSQLYKNHLRVPGSQAVDKFRPTPPMPVVDAGYCRVIYTGTNPDFLGAKAICLPTFVIIGAQKSGTDELAVWLNRNKFNRRMDGGVELHFFDCLGRGRGEERFSCERKRSFVMQDHQHENREPLLLNMTVNEEAMKLHNVKSTDFSWQIERSKGPFIDDQLWHSYLRLGHLNYRDYYKEPSRTQLFEKSPSYLDMADPRDVVRLLPRGKFVILTRDPVQRLLSSYYQFCDNPEADESPCSLEEFNEFALELCQGRLDITTPDVRLKRRQSFHRAARHGQYAELLETWIKYFWVDDDSMLDKQFLVVDAHHFRFAPLAVVYAVEGFTGNRGPIRHYKYEPRFKNGYWTLGDYSKALHPSHTDEMSPEIQEALTTFYKPSILKFRDLLARKNGPLLFGTPVGETFPSEFVNPHPTLFDGPDRFQYPPWMMKSL